MGTFFDDGCGSDGSYIIEAGQFSEFGISAPKEEGQPKLAKRYPSQQGFSLSERVHGGPKVRRGDFQKPAYFKGFFSAGSSAGLYRNLGRLCAIRCEV